MKNFARQLTSSAFWDATGITVYFGVMLCLSTVVISFLIALLLNRTFLGRGLVRVASCCPGRSLRLRPVCCGFRCSTPSSAS